MASILIVVALQNFRIELPIRSTKVRGMNNVFPIRLLYTGGLPVLFAFTVVANIQVVGYLIHSVLSKLGTSPIVISIIGNYVYNPSSNELDLNSGILNYFTSSSSLVESIISPIKTTVYSITIIVLAVWFANKWSYISGSSPKDISKQFKDQGISLAGKRDISITKELSRVIPVASVSGAFILSVVALIGDFWWIRLWCC